MKETIRKYALQNASRFKGTANPGAVIGKVISDLNIPKNKIKEVAKLTNQIIKEVNSLTEQEQEEELKNYSFKTIEKKEKELALPSPHTNVVMRFEPSPSGAMHIGHAHVLSLNHLLTKKYSGKLILRISDTNPDNIYPKAYDLIRDDARWLTNKGISKVIIQSDRMKTYYRYAKELISRGQAYVCTCPPDLFRNKIANKESCPCRGIEVYDQLIRWKKMFDSFKPGEAVLRIKTDINHKNPALRDWPAFRINETSHPRHKNKYRVWPLMNFSVAIDDGTTNVTHSIRAKDHIDNEKRQEFIHSYLGFNAPKCLYVGRLHFKDLRLSASQAAKDIEQGKYSGWDDIKLPFLPALKKRGYLPESFLEYAEKSGLTQRDKNVSKDEYFKNLNYINKQILEKKSNRYFFVPNPTKIRIFGIDNSKIKIPKHPDIKSRGNRTLSIDRTVWVSDKILKTKVYRLIGAFNFKNFEFLSKPHNPELNAQLIQWVADADKTKAELHMPDGTIKKGFVEDNIRQEKEGSTVQLVRVGFAKIIDKSKTKVVLWFTHK